jgi:SAM-dependent methyltransferase
MDLVTVKQRQQAAWASGDYSAVGARLLLTAELLCEAVDLRAGERVLDVACGNGNASLAASRRFCQVVGVDYVPALLERARRRARAEGLEATFQEADAEALPFPDAALDVVLSTCGAMFAPDQEQTAGELLRVCRPGGRIGMVNWTPRQLRGGAVLGHWPPPAAAARGAAAGPVGQRGAAAGAVRAWREHLGAAAQLPVAIPVGRAPGGVLCHFLRPHRQDARSDRRPRRRPQG